MRPLRFGSLGLARGSRKYLRSILRINEVGYRQYLREQLIEPLIDDEQWREFIALEAEALGIRADDSPCADVLDF